MVLEPGLLVADEPVSSLDASVRGEILALMLRLVRETGVTILVVTHDLGLAWNIADRIAVMYLGRIVEQGTTEELLSDPRHPYTRALLSVVPEREQHGRRRSSTGEAPDPTRIPRRLPLPPALPARRVRRGGAAGDRGALPRRGPRARARARARRRARPTAPPATPSPTAVSEEGGLRVSTRLTYTSGASVAGDRRGVRGRAGRGAQRARPSRSRTSSAARRRSTAPAFERRDPSRADRVASRAHEAPAALVAEAVERARAAQPDWRRTPVAERCAALRRAGAAIGERHMEMAAAVTLETGKSRTESIAEVQEAIDLIEAYCEQIERHDGFEVAARPAHARGDQRERAAAVRRVRRDRAVQLPRRARHRAWPPARSSPATRS